MATSNGGGATHIAKVTGQLKDLSSNLSDILMVSGGGGGGYLVGDGSINPNYIFSSANQTFATTVNSQEGTRPFVKENNGDAIAFMYYDKYSEFYGPALLARTKEATYFHIYNLYYAHDSIEVNVDGETWWLAKAQLWVHYPDTNHNWNLPILHSENYTSDWYSGNTISDSDAKDIIRKVLQLAKGIYNGEEAGGMQGSGNDRSGTQSTGYAFGQGESSDSSSGGGSGLYGGYIKNLQDGAGAGSGYIGNLLVSNKKMVGFSVFPSDAESTKTESVNTYDSNHIPDTPKVGNGHARIKLITVADLLNIKSHSNPFSKLPSDNSETDITDLSGSEITNLFTNTDILVGQKNAKTFGYDETENALVFDAGSADYTTSKYYIYLGGLYRFLRATFKYKKPIVYDLNVPNMTYMDVAKNIIASGNVIKENTNMFFNSDNQVGQGIINDYVSVTRDYSNDSRYITNYRNYIDIVAFNGKVYIKDLVIEAIKIE